GTALVLLDNGTDSFPVTGGAGTFTFGTKLINGATYAVTVQTQPQTPAQYCVVQNGTGTVAAANITNVAVSFRNAGVFAYAADSASGMVWAFTIASNTGALGIANSALTSSASSAPSGIAVDVLPNGAG